MPSPAHGQLIGFFSVLLALSGTLSAQDLATVSIHPGCLDEALSSHRLPTAIDIGKCNERFQELDVKEWLGMKRYERPLGPAGELRGSLAYEQLSADDRVLFRLQDHAGGSGVFSSLLWGRQIDKDNRKLLVELNSVEVGDRCHLGVAWIGRDSSSELFAAISMTPASIPYVLAAPPGALPNSDRDRLRARFAFGDDLVEHRSACPTCCLGHAMYQLSDNGWQLDGIELDRSGSPQHEDDELYQQLQTLSDSNPGDTELYIERKDIETLRRRLVTAHPQPTDTRRLQFWLQELGYYWTGPLDGIAGPRTKSALQAYLGNTDHGKKQSTSIESIQASILPLEGLSAQWPRLHPVDETSHDADFEKFMKELRRAIDTRNTEKLVSMTTANIMLGFGGAGGHDDLRFSLEYNDSLWKSLERAVSLGSVQQGSQFYCLPYPACMPLALMEQYDPFSTLVVTASQASLLASPDPTAEELKILDYDILTIDRASSVDKDNYYPVHHANGTAGFVSNQHVSWLIGYRLEIQRTEKGWRIVSLVSGD